MFDIGFLELLIIGVVALIVVGPERLPSLVKTTGLWVSRIRRTLSGVKREISEELRVEELRQQAKVRQEIMEEQVESIRKPFADTLRDEILSDPAETGAPSINPQVSSTKTSKVADESASTESSSAQRTTNP